MRVMTTIQRGNVRPPRRGHFGPLLGPAAALALAVTLGAALPTLAEPLPGDEVSVTFKEAVGDRFIGLVNTVMGTETVKKKDSLHYIFRVGPDGNQNDFALFYAHLPYVKAVAPAPRLDGAERNAPPVVVRVGVPNMPKAPGYVPRQLLVRFKPGTSQTAINQLNASTGATAQQQIEGIDVWQLELPPTLSVDAAQKLYASSDIVSFAEPNRVYSATQPLADTSVPPDNAGNGVYVSPGQLLGDHVIVSFRHGGPTVDLVNQIYGTHTLEEVGDDRYRISLPAGTNAVVAAHVFRICPSVSQVEPSYGR